MKITCPSCNINLEFDADHYREIAGTDFKCLDCKVSIPIPALDPPPATQKECPYCSEQILITAIRCKHCKADLETIKRIICDKCLKTFTLSKDRYEEAQRVYTPFFCSKCNSQILIPDSPPAPNNPVSSGPIITIWILLALTGVPLYLSNPYLIVINLILFLVVFIQSIVMLVEPQPAIRYNGLAVLVILIVIFVCGLTQGFSVSHLADSF